MIGATTENPSFEVITPLLSRTRVLVLHQLTKDEIILVLKRALKTLKQTKRVSPKALDYLAELVVNAGGVSVSALEMSQNSERLSWTFEEVDQRLKRIMDDIYAQSKNAAEKYGAKGNLLAGANMAGFVRIEIGRAHV